MDDERLFGRYSREECGLMPRGGDFARERLPWRGAVALLVAVGVAAWLGGEAMARARLGWLAALPGSVAARPDNARALLARGKIYASALPGSPLARRNLAFAATVAAEKAPYRLGYYANAETLLRHVDREALPAGVDRFAASLGHANALAELGRDREALAALDAAAAELPALPDAVRQAYQLVLANSQAYLLASGPAAERDAERALQLATLAVSSRDALPDGSYASDSGAFLDTLAVAYAAAGRLDEALDTQTLALGLADPGSLDIYLRHYDAFKRSARPAADGQNQRKPDVQ